MATVTPSSLTFLSDSKWLRQPLLTVQHTFFGGIKVPIKCLPHGNDREETKPYIRTVPSVSKDLKTNLLHMTPCEAVYKSYYDAGGVFQVNTCSEATRNRNQAYPLNKGLASTSGVATNSERDLLYELIQQLLQQLLQR